MPQPKLLVLSIFFGIALFSLSSCQKSYRVLSHGEIESAYRQNDVRYIPGLKEVVERQNRDLGAAAMLQLGNYYRDFALEGVYGLDQEEKRIFGDLENYFLSNVGEGTDLDFNLQNIVYRNLMFSSNPQIWEVYERVLNSPTVSEIDFANPDRENIVAVLGFIGERGKWIKDVDMSDNEFERSFSLCRKGIESPDILLFLAGVECWGNIYYYFKDQHRRDKVVEQLLEYQERFQGQDDYRYRLITSDPMLRRHSKI